MLVSANRTFFGWLQPALDAQPSAPPHPERDEAYYYTKTATPAGIEANKHPIDLTKCRSTGPFPPGGVRKNDEVYWRIAKSGAERSLASGDLERALRNSKEAVSLSHSKDAYSLCLKAQARHAIGDLNGALDDYAAALNIDHLLVSALAGRSRLYMDLAIADASLLQASLARK